MNEWITKQGKSTTDITTLQRLQYIGKRGVEALTYYPAIRKNNLNASQNIEIESLVSIAQGILDNRGQFNAAIGA